MQRPAPSGVYQLYLLDAIGPFFRGYERRTINWSKIPWQNVRGTQSADDQAWWQQVREDLRTLGKKAAAWGYTAISLDDVAHLADHEWLEPPVRARIAELRVCFRECITVLRECGLEVFLTMDVLSTTPGLRESMKQHGTPVAAFLAGLLDRFLADFPEVAGVIARIGESDGKDVHDDFHSELVIKTAGQANKLLRTLLPVFEKHSRRLIFRTWTVGAYPIGDLMWHRGTFARVVQGIESDALVISMKYGESDFFRYLPLNKNFFRTRVAKIVELQARREYEGCGEYPSFTGWEYERHIRELRQAQNIIGCMVWCQTGGWVPFRRLALLEDSALWIDLNVFVTVRLMRDGAMVEDAVADFARERGIADVRAFLELLRLSDEVIRELLYLEEFATRKMFFRRVRVPPMLQVYWHNIFISHSVKKVMLHFVSDPESVLRTSQRCLDALERMRVLAREAGLPKDDIEYMQDTFSLLALAREYYFTPFTPETEARIREAKKAYKKKYPKSGPRARYRVKTNFTPFLLQRRYLGWAMGVFMRGQRGYRWIDHILTLHLVSLAYRVISRRKPQWIPEFARDSAMGMDVVFK
jgi:hypothetical protein